MLEMFVIMCSCIRQMSINDLPVGRSVDETLRLIKAFQFVEKNGEVVFYKEIIWWREVNSKYTNPSSWNTIFLLLPMAKPLYNDLHTIHRLTHHPQDNTLPVPKFREIIKLITVSCVKLRKSRLATTTVSTL